MHITQSPPPGAHLLFFRGDFIEIILELEQAAAGKAYFRSTIGNASLIRAEIIAHVEDHKSISGQAWDNIPMVKTGDKTYSIRIALSQVGHFEGKCYFMPASAEEPVWCEGENVHINVDPAEYNSANSIYCAFVRQYGLNKYKAHSSFPADIPAECLKKLDEYGFSVIPPSGTFRELKRELKFIMEKLNCRILHLLPINPVPSTFARMGHYGSPYASLDFTGIDPALAEFDKKATPLDQFLELVDAVHQLDGKIFLDIAINHTGWAAKIHETNPEWLVRDQDGAIHSPGAWGVVWGDLTELDNNRFDLWKYLADMFLTWCERGVDGFRCDAGYMIPLPAWQYIISRVRCEFPNSIFLLEGLGGDPAVTKRLLDVGNMNWAYSELFQNYSRWDIENYIRYASSVSVADGLMVHYAETHDNSRLAVVSHTYAKMRTGLSAMLACNGAFGFANGVEWFAKEKIDVHESSALNWGSNENQVGHLARLNAILAAHPVFHHKSKLHFVDSGNSGALLFTRESASGDKTLLIAVNLDCGAPGELLWSESETPFAAGDMTDLLADESVWVKKIGLGKLSLALAPGQIVCLSSCKGDMELVHHAERDKTVCREYITFQKARASVLDILCARNASVILPEDVDLDAHAASLLESPYKFIDGFYGEGVEAPYVKWNWPEDLSRLVMLPPRKMLLVSAPRRFSLILRNANGKAIAVHNSLRGKEGFFYLVPPLADVESHERLNMHITVYGEEHSQRKDAELLRLAPGISSAEISFGRKELRAAPRTFLATNGRGGMIHACVEWGELRSRYDAWLAANLCPNHPEDRHIMWSRSKIWMIYQAYSIELCLDNLEAFRLGSDKSGIWNFRVPAGNGRFVSVSLVLSMEEGRNAVRFSLIRNKLPQKTENLDNEKHVRFIVRPEIEDRGFHYETKASCGPEQNWPGVIRSSDKGFSFKPSSDRELVITSAKGHYKSAPEWHYMVYRANEAARGLDPNSDLYSPGYFELEMGGGDSVEITGQILCPWDKQKIAFRSKIEVPPTADSSFDVLLENSMKPYVVKRDELKTVIAGYPWFLDWGRDTLICARGLIASPSMREDVKAILLQFAHFEENGTLPNMICGGNASNRDTTDAPLWLFTATEDFCKAEGSNEILAVKVKGERSLLDVLEYIAENYMKGTPNGIKADTVSGLVFSPSHFTWMDTNYPAGTPREGYPVEIQALWYAALNFIANATGKAKWRKAADKVKHSINELFVSHDREYLSDCLHCVPGIPAAQADADDHLRPNQLLAITLGAVTDKELCRKIVSSCETLLVPGGIRSLADKPVKYKLPIHGKDRHLLNNPERPYYGIYEGDEDTRRKPAYHNGTAWTWQFPLYPEAYFMTYGSPGRKTATAILSSSEILLREGCVAHLPEIMDGNYPHKERGCDAQAWGITELYRVWKLLK